MTAEERNALVQRAMDRLSLRREREAEQERLDALKPRPALIESIVRAGGR